ncbi:unnamed protein product [Prunus armeniaca]|uniref:Uncharacterized protein n=1 Tax=Prunus armeniaca TaxID=36596 RepID=A0A6J5Y4E2_PRUAR|nr:unnamed protein product [Prunus armeniaca]CAB4318338.1 unnamed protein product [Prunus armeniaca]
MEKGITWISARGSTSGKFATGLIELFAAVIVANYLSGAWNWNCSLGKDKSDNTKPEDKGKEAESNDDLDSAGKVAKTALEQFLKGSFGGAGISGASTSGF